MIEAHDRGVVIPDCALILQGLTDSEHSLAPFARNYDRMSGESKLDAMALALTEAIDTVESIKGQCGTGCVRTL